MGRVGVESGANAGLESFLIIELRQVCYELLNTSNIHLSKIPYLNRFIQFEELQTLPEMMNRQRNFSNGKAR